MVLNITLSKEAETRLKSKALAEGVDLDTFASKELERIASCRSLDEMLAPLRRQVEESGMTEDQLTDFLEDVKHEARAERRAGQSS